MKTKSKALLLTLCAVLLVAASVLGTMAYLTDNDTVTNTFTVGNVKLGGDNEAGLDEAKVNEDGKPMKKSDDGETWQVVQKVEDADRVKENKYKLQPGHTYTKDPTVHVTGDECYVFVTVSNGIAAIEDSSNTIASQMTANGWKLVEGYTNLYVYAKGTDAKTAVSGTKTTSTDLVVFEKFKIADNVSNDETATNKLSSFADKNIVVNAYAVQVDGFADKTPAQIWTTAFSSVTTATKAPAPEADA